MTLEELKTRFSELQNTNPHIRDVCRELGGENYKVPDQIGSEFKSIVEYYQSLQATTVLEIGTYQGGSLWYWVKYAAPNAIVVSIDLDHSQCDFWHEFDKLRPDVNLIKISAASEDPDTIQQVKKIADKFDFVFIDGYHYFPNVRTDWETYGKSAHVCAFHDIGNGEHPLDPQDVRVMWNEIVSLYANTVSMIQLDFQKAAYGIGVVRP